MKTTRFLQRHRVKLTLQSFENNVTFCVTDSNNISSPLRGAFFPQNIKIHLGASLTASDVYLGITSKHHLCPFTPALHNEPWQIKLDISVIKVH